MITCQRCGHANDPDREFCTACDAYLEWNADPHPEPAPERGAGFAPLSGAGSSLRQEDVP
jgi:hypothetical protein